MTDSGARIGISINRDGLHARIFYKNALHLS